MSDSHITEQSALRVAAVWLKQARINLQMSLLCWLSCQQCCWLLLTQLPERLWLFGQSYSSIPSMSLSMPWLLRAGCCTAKSEPLASVRRQVQSWSIRVAASVHHHQHLPSHIWSTGRNEYNWTLKEAESIASTSFSMVCVLHFFFSFCKESCSDMFFCQLRCAEALTTVLSQMGFNSSLCCFQVH